MNTLTAIEKITIFSRYIGQQVVINSTLTHDTNTIGILNGIRNNALLVSIDNVNRWIPIYDEIALCEIKLLLKPLKKLTSQIISTANNLPVQAFITPYYQQLGFDMPVFIAPGHPCNCKYVYELNLADYTSYSDTFPSQHHEVITA